MDHAQAWQWDSLEPQSGYGPHIGHQILAGGATVQRWRIAKPDISIEHSHPYDQWLFVLEGRMSITCGDVVHRLVEGSVLRIPANTSHAAVWETECDLLEIGMGQDPA